MHVIVTRPAAQAETWVAELHALGVPALALPLLGIAPAPDLAAVHAAWAGLPGLDLVVFVSANAVRQFFGARPAAATWPAALVAASTGPGTSAALRAHGVNRVEEPAPDAAQFDSEALWQRLSAQPWQGRQVLVVRGEEGRDWLGDTLRQHGARVGFVVAYRRTAPVLDAAANALLARALAEPADHVWLFSNSESIGHLLRLAPQADWSKARAFATHPRIVQTARQAGFGSVDVAAPSPAAVAARLRLG